MNSVKAINVHFDFENNYLAKKLSNELQEINAQMNTLLLSKMSIEKRLATLVGQQLEKEYTFEPGEVVFNTDFNLLYILSTDNKLYYINEEVRNENS